MTGPAPTKRTRMMVEAYISGGTLEEVATIFNVSKQRVWAAVRRHAKEALALKGVGPPGGRIFNVGSCCECEISLWAKRREARTMCGYCEAKAKAAA